MKNVKLFFFVFVLGFCYGFYPDSINSIVSNNNSFIKEEFFGRGSVRRGNLAASSKQINLNQEDLLVAVVETNQEKNCVILYRLFIPKEEFLEDIAVTVVVEISLDSFYTLPITFQNIDTLQIDTLKIGDLIPDFYANQANEVLNFQVTDTFYIQNPNSLGIEDTSILKISQGGTISYNRMIRRIVPLVIDTISRNDLIIELPKTVSYYLNEFRDCANFIALEETIETIPIIPNQALEEFLIYTTRNNGGDTEIIFNTFGDTMRWFKKYGHKNKLNLCSDEKA